jgi:hypothetical protein
MSFWAHVSSSDGWKRSYTYLDGLLLLIMSTVMAATVGLSVSAVKSRNEWKVEPAE